MNPQQQQTLIAVINAVHSAIVVLSNYAQTTDDQQQIALCQQTIGLLNAIGTAALQALQANNDQLFQQETGILKTSAYQLKAEEAQINTILHGGGIAIQVISALVQIAALVAIL